MNEVLLCEHRKAYGKSILNPKRFYWICAKCGETGVTFNNPEPPDVLDEELYARIVSKYVRGSRK